MFDLLIYMFENYLSSKPQTDSNIMTIELEAAGFNNKDIKNALKELSNPEYSDCCKALVKKYWLSNRNKPLVIRKKKSWTALQYRGWETELIMENILSLEHQKE